MPADDLIVGDIIHVNSSNAEVQLMCNAAIVGGTMGNNWWIVVMSFNGSRVAWLTDEIWHYKDDCTTNPRQAQEAANGTD